jgi:hypothetical protein
MPITRPAPPQIIAGAEINDDCLVEVSLWGGTNRVAVVPLTPSEAIAFADELRTVAAQATEIASAEVPS